MDGDEAQLVERRTVASLTQVWFPGVARDFAPRANLLCRLSYMCPYTLMCNEKLTHATKSLDRKHDFDMHYTPSLDDSIAEHLLVKRLDFLFFFFFFNSKLFDWRPSP